MSAITKTITITIDEAAAAIKKYEGIAPADFNSPEVANDLAFNVKAIADAYKAADTAKKEAASWFKGCFKDELDGEKTVTVYGWSEGYKLVANPSKRKGGIDTDKLGAILAEKLGAVEAAKVIADCTKPDYTTIAFAPKAITKKEAKAHAEGKFDDILTIA